MMIYRYEPSFRYCSVVVLNSNLNFIREVNARIDEGDFAGDANLNGLAAVLAGSEEAFNLELVEKCESWYQWMIGEIWSHMMMISGNWWSHMVTNGDIV